MQVPDYSSNPDAFKAAISQACEETSLMNMQMDLMRFSGDTAKRAGELLHLHGHFVGDDRKDRASPFGNGSDEVVGVSVLLSILGELTLGFARLFEDRLLYAASALLRQLVEVEYLAWAIETRDKDAERWLRSDGELRGKLFRPSKLLKAAGEGRFRGVDYGFHCEYGGHPTPAARMLLQSDPNVPEILKVDALGHIGRVLDHVARWSKKTNNPLFWSHYPASADRFMAWKAVDLLAHLPAPSPEAMGMA